MDQLADILDQDLDPTETREWIESLSAVIQHDGTECGDHHFVVMLNAHRPTDLRVLAEDHRQRLPRNLDSADLYPRHSDVPTPPLPVQHASLHPHPGTAVCKDDR